MPTLSAEKRFTQSRLSQTILASWIMQILFVSSEKVKSIKVVRNDCIGPSHRDFYSEKNCTYEDYVLSLRRTDAIRTRFVPATHDGPCATALPTFGTVSPSHQRRWEMLPGCPTPRPVLHRGGLSVGPPPTENVDHVAPGQEKKERLHWTERSERFWLTTSVSMFLAARIFWPPDFLSTKHGRCVKKPLPENWAGPHLMITPQSSLRVKPSLRRPRRFPLRWMPVWHLQSVTR